MRPESIGIFNNIDLAFKAWNQEWAKDVPFEDFCRYILPYRVQAETPTKLRKEFMDRYLPLLQKADPKTPLEACIIINQELIRTFGYDKTGGSPLYPSIEHTYETGIGICDALCMLGISIMRAVGIPVAMEETTWTKGDRGHNWAAVLSNGQFSFFCPCSDQPGQFVRMFAEKRSRRPAKVYRTRYDLLRPVQIDDDDGYITYLKNPFLEDVITQYPTDAVDLHVTVDKGSVQGESIVYLCAYNMQHWEPFAMGVRKNEQCMFENVAGDNIFIIADSPNGHSLRFITAPFYVNPLGEIRKIVPDTAHRRSFVLDKIEYEGKWDLPHTFQYWDTKDDEFVTLPIKNDTDSTLICDEIPENALLRFTIPKRKYNIRIFSIENDRVVTY